MSQFFPHEKLEVYSRALSFAKLSAALIDSWPSIVAVCDQLDRATERIVTNLAKAARLRATENGIYCLECSLGSVLECAACLDVAYCRHLLDSPALRDAKHVLQEIARMEVGLRHSWSGCAKEESEPYSTDAKHYFLHESLVVYQRSLQVHAALDGLWGLEHKRGRYARRVDELSTSLTINIAEGNGRFTKADRRNFFGIARGSVQECVPLLELAVRQKLLEVEGHERLKAALEEIARMLSGLINGLDKREE